MNQIFEEFRTILLHQSNCFLPFSQHRVHGINKNEGLLSFANQAQKLRSPFKWGILSLKVLPLVVVSTFRQFCSTLCSAKLSTIPVEAEARRRSADQFNEPGKFSLQSLLLRKSGPLLGFATQNQLRERSNLHFCEAKVSEAKVTGYPCAPLLRKSEAFGNSKYAHFRFAKLPKRSSGYPLRGLRVRARRGFYPVTFASLNFLSGGSKGSNCRNGVTVTHAHFCFAKLPERSSGNPLRGFRPSGTRATLELEQEGGSKNARLPRAQPTVTRATLEFEQEGAKTCWNGATPAVGCRAATRVELLPNSFGTQHGQAPTEQLKLYSGVTPSVSTTKQNKQQGLTFGKLELLAVLGTARNSSSTFKTNFGVRKTSLNPRATLSLFLWPLVLGPSSRCSCSCSSFLSTSKSYARLEDNLKFTQPFTVWGVVVDTKCCGTKLLDCRRSPFTTLLEQSKVRFGVSSPALCNNATNTKYKISRPLLNLSRENLTILCKDLHLPVYPDKSNKAVQYSRNRLREQILPAIKLFLNPKIDHALFKLAELLTQDFSLVSNLVNTGRRSSSPLARAHPSGEQGLPGT